MASAAIFSCLRRRRSPSLEVFLVPVDLSDIALLQTLASISAEMVSNFKDESFFFQRRNSRTLIRRIEVFVVLLENLRESRSSLPNSAVLCFKELYLLLYRAKILLDYCSRSGKLWLLLQNRSISGHFYDLNQEIYTLLEVLPVKDLKLSDDVIDQVELLRRQSRRDKLFIDEHDESLRFRFYGFLDEFEEGRVPSRTELEMFFVEKLKIRDAKSCWLEIEYLEEQVVNHQVDLEPAASVLNGFIALARYCRFRLYESDSEDIEVEISVSKCVKKKNTKSGLITKEIAETFVSIPKDFCCPISLDLMHDPVVTSTGQTYDRRSISRWVQEGHVTCPKTGQLLAHSKLVPNRALRNLIGHWCSAHGILYDPLESADSSSSEFPAMGSPLKASVEANKATSALLVNDLSSGSEVTKTVAAREVRFMAKTGKENRALLAEAGVIPYLKELLSSANPVAQENSVTAMLNLSIYDKNKSRIMEEHSCLSSIVDVLRLGHTVESRENAAATLFSLSAVHDYKRRIADEDGAVEALLGLLRNGTSRGKKDAVTALFNLCTHSENCTKMIDSGAAAALISALGDETVAEEAAGALTLIVRRPAGAAAVAREEAAVTGLIGMMRAGTPRGKENAVAALLEICRSGGTSATERVVGTPAMVGLLQTLVFTGTKRARRKAASLARVFQRNENSINRPTVRLGGPGQGYAFEAGSGAGRGSGFGSDVSMPVSISVPVL